MECMHISSVSMSGFLVSLLQVLHSVRFALVYFIVLPSLPVVRVLWHAIHSVQVVSLSAMNVLIPLCRCLVEQGAHQCWELCIVHSAPLMSKEPQFIQLGGGGVGMFECEHSRWFLHGAQSGVGVGSPADHRRAAGAVVHCAQRASCGGYDAIACLYCVALIPSASSIAMSLSTVWNCSAGSCVFWYMKRGLGVKFSVGRGETERIVTVFLSFSSWGGEGVGSDAVSFREPGVPLPHNFEILGGVVSYRGWEKT